MNCNIKPRVYGRRDGTVFVYVCGLDCFHPQFEVTSRISENYHDYFMWKPRNRCTLLCDKQVKIHDFEGVFCLSRLLQIWRELRQRSRILCNKQLDAFFHVVIYFTSLHISSVTALIIRRSNCINTSSGVISHLHRLITPDDVLIQFDLLMMSAEALETCRDMKKINTWKSASSWLFPRIVVTVLISTFDEFLVYKRLWYAE